MSSIERFTDTVRGKGLSVVLPEGDDERIMRAARRLVDEDIARPVVVGEAADFEAAGIATDGITITSPMADEAETDRYAQQLVDGPRNVELATARKLARKRLYFGALMAKSGDVDTFVAGAVYPTARVIEAGLRCVGLAPGIRTASSFFLMELEDFIGTGPKTLMYADCAVVINPTAEQLADITISSARSAEALLDSDPRIAMLSFSTHGSAKHADAEKVIEAAAIVREREPALAIDGEIQADSALISAIAERKLTQPSRVAGQANVLVFPDLDAGNIAYKLTQYLARAQAIGPVLQGFARPISDLSRGASVDDIVGVTAVCLAQVPTD